jgi:hypothetical protein
MVQYGTWNPYEGSSALLLALALFVIGCVLVYLGLRQQSPIKVDQSGKIVSILLVTMWCLSIVIFLNSIVMYMQSLIQQVGPFTPPTSPVSPITYSSGLITFIIIAYLSRLHGLKIALGSAIVGTIAAPMIFELPFDLIVMWRLYPPVSTQLTLLYFLPLFLVEISSFSLLTLSPITKISKYTFFSLAAVFFVFAIWALFGFSYPSSPILFVFNAVSKVLCFITAITLFLPQKEMSTKEDEN